MSFFVDAISDSEPDEIAAHLPIPVCSTRTFNSPVLSNDIVLAAREPSKCHHFATRNTAQSSSLGEESICLRPGYLVHPSISNLRCSTRGDLGLCSLSFYGLHIISEWNASIGDCVEIKGSMSPPLVHSITPGIMQGRSQPLDFLDSLIKFQSSVGPDAQWRC